MPYILIADDDENFAAMVRESLRSKGYDADVVKDSFAFAAAVAKRLPSAAIIDMQMPGGGALMALRSLRSGTQAGVIPAIICSGMPIEQTLKWFPGAARLDVLQKPLDLDALLRTLAALLAQP